MNLARIAALLTLFAATACETQRYQSNIRGLYVNPKAKLSPSDIEEIVRVVTHATIEPISGVTQWLKDRQVHVVTGGNEEDLTHDYTLEKTGGRWHIVRSGTLSPVLVRLVLEHT